MRQLQEKHPQVHHAFMTGEHAIARSNQPFAKVWTDMALEQSINLDSRTSGGVVGISPKPGALQAVVRNSPWQQHLNMLGMADSDLVATHKDARDGRLKRD
ncbi:Hypp5341 [Branchiostoma lanceolatum]|uniref:Hypp5341 protein n=1 Tax=Branchiostoma lanceolatum TaxID=7740 RepID=A0A8K0AFV5_BRALA|nr:Hypp5341 [Branchiostoma lanceolatum]